MTTPERRDGNVTIYESRPDGNVYLYRYRADAHTLAAAGVDEEPPLAGVGFLDRLRAAWSRWWDGVLEMVP